MRSAPIFSAAWITGSEVMTIWISRIAMNMPKHMAAKPAHSLNLSVSVNDGIAHYGERAPVGKHDDWG